MTPVTRTAISPGIQLLDAISDSPTQGTHLYLLKQYHNHSGHLPTLEFTNVPMYAQWFRREAMAWYALYKLDTIGTSFNILEYQEYYDATLTANASAGHNALLKDAYDTLCGEGTRPLAQLATTPRGLDALYIVIQDFVREGNNLDKWLRNAPAAEEKAVKAALIKGSIAALTAALSPSH